MILAMYPGLTNADMKIIRLWQKQYSGVYEVGSVSYQSTRRPKKSQKVELPPDSESRFK